METVVETVAGIADAGGGRAVDAADVAAGAACRIPSSILPGPKANADPKAIAGPKVIGDLKVSAATRHRHR